jgi:drug/metabolite transporter (DMT)-like permease
MKGRWLIWALVAVFSWGIWAFVSKLLGEALTAAQSQALSTLGLLPIFALLAFSGKLAGAANRRGAAWALAAGILGCLGNLAYYHALNLGGKAVTVAPLTALYPLVTVALAVLLLKEKLNRIQLVGISLSLVAIYLFNVQSNSGLISKWLLFALLPILFWGLAGLTQKIATNHLSGEASTLWFLAAFVPVAIVILITNNFPEHVSARTWGLVIALGFFFGLGNYGILAAFAYGGKASVITPLSGLYPIVSVPLAIYLLREQAGPREIAGIAAALLSVVALSWESSVPKDQMPEKISVH